MSDLTVAAPLREALTAAGYRYDAVIDLLGPVAHAALERNETTPALRATTDGSPLSTLIRLFLLQQPVPLDDAERALAGLVDRLATIGVLSRSVAEVAARLDVRPYATDRGDDLWLIADLTPGLDGGPHQVGPDHVLGVSSASTSLAQLTVRDEVGSALDLGTGCGVQALHLTDHVDRVVATDVNPRALWLARLNAALAGVDETVEVREGSYFEPVSAERFDLVVTNPPFVISPGTGERLVYRDSGLPGDRVVEQIARDLPDRLTDGGWGQILGNWVIRADQAWDQRLEEWLGPECDALVVQRERIDTAAYVEMWLKDAGHHGGPGYRERYDTWMSWFAEQQVEEIGFGWINLHRTGGGTHELIEWPYTVEQPVAPAIAEWGRAVAVSHGLDDAALLAAHLRLRPDVTQETHGRPGAADPERVVLRQQTGLCRARSVDTATAAVAGACDGDLPVGALVDAVAGLLAEDAVALRATQVPVLRELLTEGFVSVSSEQH